MEIPWLLPFLCVSASTITFQCREWGVRWEGLSALYRKSRTLLSTALPSLTKLLERDKRTTTVFVEHLLLLIGDVIRHCSSGLKVVHNHSKAYSSLAYTGQSRNQGDVFRCVSVCIKVMPSIYIAWKNIGPTNAILLHSTLTLLYERYLNFCRTSED